MNMGATTIEIVILDDLRLVRLALRTLLEQKSGLKVLTDAGNGHQGISLVSDLSPHVVIIGISALDLTANRIIHQIVATSPETKILALSMFASRPFVMQMFRAGVVGYLLRDCLLEELVEAIHLVVHGQLYLSSAISNGDVESLLTGLSPTRGSNASHLTIRERQVLHQMTQGKSRSQIALDLQVTPKTIESHMLNIKNKLGLTSPAALTKYALREGLISLDS